MQVEYGSNSIGFFTVKFKLCINFFWGGGGICGPYLVSRVPTFEDRKTPSQSRHMYKEKLMTDVSYVDHHLRMDAVLAAMVLLLYSSGFRILSQEIILWITEIFSGA